MKKNKNKLITNISNPDYFGSVPDNYSHKYDYPREQVWGTYYYLAQLIAPRLQALKALDKHGYPPECKDMRGWNNAIQKMIDAFELINNDYSFSDDDDRTITEGLDLFCKHFRDLWD